MPFTIVSSGTFTQPATAVNQYINLPSGADYFRTTNITQMPLAPATAVVIRGEWYNGGLFADNDGIRWKKTNSTNAIQIDTFATATATNGFTYVSRYPDPEAALTGTTITNATPAVATVTNTYSEGDRVVIYGSTGALQYSGMSFTISSVSGSGFTLLGLNSPGSAATAFQVRRIPKHARVEPRALFITGITQAAQGVVTVSEAHEYVVGEKIVFNIPGSFGMTQLNSYTQRVPAVITAVGTYTMTINVNTTNFTAFAFPATSGSPTTQLFAMLTSAGQSTQFNPVTNVTTGYNFTYVPYHTGQFIPYMYVPAGAQTPGGAAGDVIVWEAYKFETGILNAPVPT